MISNKYLNDLPENRPKSQPTPKEKSLKNLKKAVEGLMKTNLKGTKMFAG